jgi:cytoskeletal protein CcmA (bactofilin family)
MDHGDQREIKEATASSMIGADIVVTGNIEAEVDLQIEGRVNGDVRCATLILGEHSCVNGNVYAQRVRVSGTIEGSVETRDLAVEATARVSGQITYERLRVANGGIVEGSMTVKVSEEPLAEASRLKLVEPAAASPDTKSRAIYIE